MANQIIIRRSAVAGKVPSLNELALGELAINHADGKIYIKKNYLGNEQIVDVTENQLITISGDASATGKSSLVLTLSNTGVTAGTYTKVTVDGKGRVLTASSLTNADMPAITWDKLIGLPTTLEGFGIVDAQPLDPDLSAISVVSGGVGFLKKVGTNAWQLIEDAYTPPTINLSGDVYGGGVTNIPVTLQTVNTNSGTYGTSTRSATIIVNEKGLVTGSSDVAIAFPVVSVANKTGAVNLVVTDIAGAAPTSSPTFSGTVTIIGSLVMDGSSTVGMGGGVTGSFSKISELSVTNGVTGTYILDTFLATEFHSCEYFVQCRLNSTIGYEALKLLLVQDETNVYLTEYGRVGTGAELAQFSAIMNGSSVELKYTQTGDMTVTAVRTALN